VAKRIQTRSGVGRPGLFVLYPRRVRGFARFIPPMAPSWDPVKVTQVITDHAISIRIGMVLGLIATTFAVSVLRGDLDPNCTHRETDADPGRDAVRRRGAPGGVFQLCGMLWITATFRSELEPSTIRMLDDCPG